MGCTHRRSEFPLSTFLLSSFQLCRARHESELVTTPSLITLDNQTIIFYYYKEVSIECLCQHWHPPAHSQHRSCSESKPTLDKCVACTGVFLCGHVSVYMCIHQICQHVTHLGISLEMSCYVTALSLRMVNLSNVFSQHYDKFQRAASGKIGNHIQDFDTS